MFYRRCRVREISPGTHTFFHTYTCPVYCWRSVQLLDFGLCGNLIHASQPIRTTFTGQCFAYGFLQTPPHGDALAFGCILPTAGRIRDFHPLERAPAGRTTKKTPYLCDMESCVFSSMQQAKCKVTDFNKESFQLIECLPPKSEISDRDVRLNTTNFNAVALRDIKNSVHRVFSTQSLCAT